ncbi:MAG: aminoacyl-histidine dipeptidase [Moraxella sp.]|nr:aminoacyl-histidine dipeptidase [Moraxella sp.]
MTSSITTLNPSLVWHWFDIICAIPHPSFHENALAEYIVNWATQKGLVVTRDDADNVFISKNATQGYEEHAPIALQAHLDMVTQANGKFDFLNEPIRPYIDGDWVTAQGTTLGADNGIGLASILAVLDSDELAHPKIEALLTMTEETGMVGARHLASNKLTAKRMINTDTEEIGEIYLGCAGGVDVEIDLPVVYTANHTTDSAISLTIKGLKGGHSGIDIHKNNANAIKLLAHILANVGVTYRLASVSGGTARNAIPRSARAVLVVNNDHQQALNEALTSWCQEVKKLVGGYETALTWEIHTESLPDEALTAESTRQVVDLLNATPNGVWRYSDQVADTVESSLSLGMVSLDKQGVHFVSLVRSLNQQGKNSVTSALLSLARVSGANAVLTGDYIGWNPNPTSAITQVVEQAYRQLGFKPEFKVIHAGLECGLIQCAYPDMDIVSIGPTIKNAHSPDEKVHIASVATYWQVLTYALANAPK